METTVSNFGVRGVADHSLDQVVGFLGVREIDVNALVVEGVGRGRRGALGVEDHRHVGSVFAATAAEVAEQGPPGLLQTRTDPPGP